MEPSVDVFGIARSVVTNLLRNTIETYPPEWRLIQEPLQNAIDSFLNDDGTIIEMDGIKPKVTLELYIGSNKVKIIDNGKGIPVEGFSNFLILGDGTKGSITESDVKKLLKGSQGVGIKSTVFTSKLFSVDTTCSGQRWELTLEDCYNYNSSKFNSVIDAPTPYPSTEHNGTIITVQLDHYTVWNFIEDRVDDFFKTIGVSDLDINDETIDLHDGKQPIPYVDLMKILMRYLKKDSYVGCVTRKINSGSGLPDIDFELKIICDFTPEDANKYQIKGIKPLQSGKEYLSSDTIGYLDYQKEIDKLPPRQKPKIVTDFKVMLETANNSESLTVFYQCLTKDDVRKLCGNLRKRKQSDPPSPYSYVLEDYTLSKHKLALERVNGAILFIAPRPFLKNPFVHKSTIGLSVNGLPTDITLDFSGGELGYVPSVHLVLDVDETLGYGKRNLHPRSKGIYNDLAKTLWVNLHKLAKLIIGTTETDTDLSITGLKFDLDEENAKIIEKSKRDRYFEITGRITEPETEEDLITTYFFMVGKGYLQNYQWMRLHDNTIYDALSKNPEGSSSPFNIEFKVSSDELCKSDESGRQKFNDIKIAIVWELTPDEKLLPGYTCIYRDQDISFKNYYPDVNYRIKHNRDSVQIIALKEIVEEMILEGPE